MDKINLRLAKGFQWDEGNHYKYWLKHNVTHSECEQVFFNEPLLVMEAATGHEPRFLVLGRTDEMRELFIVFTVRNDHIRIISARNMSRKEKNFYEKNYT